MSETIRKVEIAGLLLALVLAGSVFAVYFPPGLYLDLSLILALYIGWYSPPVKGAASGMMLGWLQDAISGNVLGLNGLSKTALGFSGSYLGKWLVLEGFLARCLLIGGLSLLDNAVLGAVSYLLGEPVQPGLWRHSLVEFPITGIVGGLFFFGYNRFKFPRKDFTRLQGPGPV